MWILRFVSDVVLQWQYNRCFRSEIVPGQRYLVRTQGVYNSWIWTKMLDMVSMNSLYNDKVFMIYSINNQWRYSYYDHKLNYIYPTKMHRGNCSQIYNLIELETINQKPIKSRLVGDPTYLNIQYTSFQQYSQLVPHYV